MKRIFLVLLCFLLLIATSGCTSLFLRKDTLIELDDSDSSADENIVTATVKIDTYATLYSGTILAYDEGSGINILTQTEIAADNSYQSTLMSYYNDVFLAIYSSAGSFSEASIDPKTHDIYFKLKDTTADTSALYWSDLQGDTKVRLCEDVYDKYLAWDYTDDGYLVYVNKDNQIMLGDKDAQTAVFTLDSNYSVKEIAYYSEAQMLILIASTSQTSNILYRIDLNGSPALNAIDVNVNDFAFSSQTGQTAYTKTTSGGDDQLYVYDYQSYLREYLCSNYIEKLSYSPNGSYIAFSTKATSEIPTQSIWIIPSNSTIPIQLTANTLLNSSIIWTEDSSGIIFTTGNVSEAQNTAEPEYTTYYLKFSFDNNDSSETPTDVASESDTQ